MSRIGKKPIEIPGGVSVEIIDQKVSAKGPLGQDSVEFIDTLEVLINNNILTVVNKKENDKQNGAYFGLYRSLISNLISGVFSGFEKNLEIIGVGYRATQQKQDVVFQLGYSHNITFTPPEGVTLEVVDATKIKVKGINKQQVGQVAANIRKLRPPEPYKGKGIRYKDEYVRKKAGKAGK